MNEKKLIKKCLIDDDAIETYPFNEERYGKMPVIRHKSNDKWFALIFRLDGILYINLKAEPETISILKDQYPESITPAWHLNVISEFPKVKDTTSIPRGLLLNRYSRRAG